MTYLTWALVVLIIESSAVQLEKTASVAELEDTIKKFDQTGVPIIESHKNGLIAALAWIWANNSEENIHKDIDHIQEELEKIHDHTKVIKTTRDLLTSG